MRAAWYEKQGPAKDVLTVGEMPDPHPAAGEVRIHIAASGINPGDIKKRQDAFGYGMAYARVIPHSDGAGQVDEIGSGVPPEWLGQSVWCHGAQSYRPFVVPRPSLRWSHWIKWLACPQACRWSRAPVLGYPVSLHIAPSMLLASSVDGPC